MQLSKSNPRKLWRKFLIHKTKENHMIPLNNWNSYLENIYESPNSMDTIFNSPIEHEIFLWNTLSLGLNGSQLGKLKAFKATKMEFLK